VLLLLLLWEWIVVCPRCQARVADLPTTCNLHTHTHTRTQVSSSHIARSYHHLFPVAPYTELKAGEHSELDHCHGCLRFLDVASERVVRLRCPRCSQAFCIDCDMYVHETLHECPGCSGVG
jgi:transcription initiation factor TFIIH subunit 2